jgi:hypothetical protein
MTRVVHNVAVRDVTTKMPVLSEGDTRRMVQNTHNPHFGTKSEGDTGGIRSFILHISDRRTRILHIMGNVQDRTHCLP